MTEIGEIIPQRYCSGRDAGGHDADERRHIHVTEFAAQSNVSIHREERKAAHERAPPEVAVHPWSSYEGG